MSDNTDLSSALPLPAHQTKHLPRLRYPLPDGTIVDIQQDGGGATARNGASSSTGRTIWLGGQILAGYLASIKHATRRKKDGSRPVAIDVGSGTGACTALGIRNDFGDRCCIDLELLWTLDGSGSVNVSSTRSPSLTSLGIGLLALSLATQGFDVLATDVALLAEAPEGLLERNLASNRHLWPSTTLGQVPRVEARVLDWMSDPSSWDFSKQTINSGSPLALIDDPAGNNQHDTEDGPTAGTTTLSGQTRALLEPPFDLITSSDSVYSDALVQPLLRTLHALCTLSITTTTATTPAIYLAIEVRDPLLVQRFLDSARDDYGFKCARVDDARIEGVVRPWGWDRNEWDGVEVWKLTLGRRRFGQRAAVHTAG